MPEKLTDHKLIAALCGVALVLVAGSLVWSYYTLHTIQSPLILHYNDDVGVTQTGSLGSLMGMGILGVIVVLMNAAIAFELAERDKFLGTFLATMTVVFAVLLFIGVSAIIGVN